LLLALARARHGIWPAFAEPNAVQTVPARTTPPETHAIVEDSRRNASEDSAAAQEKQADTGDNDRLRVAFRQALKEVVAGSKSSREVRPHRTSRRFGTVPLRGGGSRRSRACSAGWTRT